MRKTALEVKSHKNTAQWKQKVVLRESPTETEVFFLGGRILSTALRNWIISGSSIHLILVIAQMATTCTFMEIMLRPRSSPVCGKSSRCERGVGRSKIPSCRKSNKPIPDREKMLLVVGFLDLSRVAITCASRLSNLPLSTAFA